jgi:hypothetical protein
VEIINWEKNFVSYLCMYVCMVIAVGAVIAKEMSNYNSKKGKGKAIPLQALTGPEGSRRLRLPDFKTIGT